MDDIEYMDRIDAFLESVRDRLAPGRYDSMVGTSRAGEPDEILEELLATFFHDRVPIRQAEAAALREIATSFPLPVPYMTYINDRDRILASLNVVEDAGAREAPAGVTPVHTAQRTHASPLVVHQAPVFDRAVEVPVAVHVDLAPAYYDSFVEYFTSAVGVGIEANLSRTNPEGRTDEDAQWVQLSEQHSAFVPDLVRLVAGNAVCGGGVLLRSFEQWWLKGRPEAEAFLRALPGMLATARAEGKRLHIGLAEIITPTVTEVLAVLESAELDMSETEIPVFVYPA